MKKSKTYSSLKRNLDAVFSRWLRSKDSDGRGVATCVTCGQKRSWQELQCGHYISRVHLSTRWLPENCAVQCSTCNVLRRGNFGEFTLYLIKTYGLDHIQKLVDLKRKSVKYSRGDLQAMIEEYQAKLEAL